VIDKNKISEIWQYLTQQEKKELTELAYYAELIEKEWKPLPGPQTEAYYSEADHLFFGGSAGGGKTDCILGIAHQQHKRTVIYRREYSQLKGIIERGRELFDHRDKGRFNQQKNHWRLKDGRLIELGACQHAGDEQKHQGVPHDAIFFDEITHFTEYQFRFLCGWLRSVDKTQRKRVICAGNPPTSAEGDWVIKYWAPWLDEHYSNPANPGELRWFTTLNGEDVEVPTGEPFEHDGEILKPESRTFIPAKIEDNPYLMDAGYKQRLQALPEPLRSKLLFGDFTAGREDDAWQVIPTEWVKLAQKRWREITDKDSLPLTQIGVDVARGGSDKTVITIRSNNIVVKQIVHPGTSTPDGDTVAGFVIKELKNSCSICIDIIGVGSSVYDVLRRTFKDSVHQQKLIWGFNASKTSTSTDKTRMISFINMRAQAYWQLREALDPLTGDNISVPDDRELLADLCSVKWELKANGIKMESKEDIIGRIRRSPDKGDSMVYAFARQGIGISEYPNMNLLGR
jgi:hypothetical protein